MTTCFSDLIGKHEVQYGRIAQNLDRKNSPSDTSFLPITLKLAPHISRSAKQTQQQPHAAVFKMTGQDSDDEELYVRLLLCSHLFYHLPPYNPLVWPHDYHIVALPLLPSCTGSSLPLPLTP